MYRWLLALLLTAAVVAFLSPGIVGLLGERQMQQALGPPSPTARGPRLETLHFERRWFSSLGRHRLPLTEPPLSGLVASLAGLAPGADAPVALLIATRFDHGPLPVSAAARGAAAIEPALASNVSTLSLKFADGRTLPLPGRIDSRLTLTGGLQVALANARLEMPEGPVRLALSLELPEAGLLAAWPGLLMSLSGWVEFSVPAAMATPGTPAGDALQGMLAAGFLAPYDGRRYRMQLDLENGSLAVNGAPYPLGQLTQSAN